MTTFLITRHPGAVAWITQQGFQIDVTQSHLDLAPMQPGDVVFGTLPVNLAAAVCARGARFFNLSLDLPEYMRGKELSVDELRQYRARFEEYHVETIAC